MENMDRYNKFFALKNTWFSVFRSNIPKNKFNNR